jgi:hypothetical protein
MACCGQRRALASVSGRAVEAGRPRTVSRVALYEYTGTTGMTVTGPVSGMKYRFGQPAAQVQIDLRDVSSLAGLPNLRRIQ